MLPMANDDLLQQFKKLLEENTNQLEQNFQKRQEDNNKQLRLEIREDTKAEIKAEVAPLHERLDAQREQINTVEKNLSEQITRQGKHIATVKTELTEKIDQQTHAVADILAKAVMPDIDRHESEIKELQKAVGLRPKH